MAVDLLRESHGVRGLTRAIFASLQILFYASVMTVEFNNGHEQNRVCGPACTPDNG